MATQRQRVLRALRRHPEGLTQVDWLLPHVVDGGHPITRLAARVKDLRDEGHEIEVQGERYGCAVYVIPQPAPVPVPPPESPQLEPAEPTLFDAQPRNAIIDVEAA